MKCIAAVLCSFLVSYVVAQTKISRDSSSIIFQLPDSVKATQVYASLASGIKARATYSLAFNRGKLGMQSGPKQKSFVFNIYTRGALLATGINVRAIRPGYFQWNYNWQEGSQYRMLITTLSDSASNSTIYTGYVFLPEKNQWKLLASYRSYEGVEYIKFPSIRINSGKSKKQVSLSVQQCWVQRRNGSWKQLTEQTFESTPEKFFLTTDTGNLVVSNQRNANQVSTSFVFTLKPAPLINVTNHVDSLEQSRIDKAEILMAVANKKIDTSGAINDVYYQMLKEGTGEQVKLSDTLSVYYKGWLLKNEQVFDQTKDKPATFPLARLIKGWQIGLTQCRAGGKIRLFIPSGLAYSIRSRSKDIPPNSVLVFDVEVLEARHAL